MLSKICLKYPSYQFDDNTKLGAPQLKLYNVKRFKVYVTCQLSS